MAKRSSSQRDAVKAPTPRFYAKRTAAGEFKEMDEAGKSLRADRRPRSPVARRRDAT